MTMMIMTIELIKRKKHCNNCYDCYLEAIIGIVINVKMEVHLCVFIYIFKCSYKYLYSIRVCNSYKTRKNSIVFSDLVTTR